MDAHDTQKIYSYTLYTMMTAGKPAGTTIDGRCANLCCITIGGPSYEQNALVSAGGAQATSSEHTPSAREY
jgi:hypothetical protein